MYIGNELHWYTVKIVRKNDLGVYEITTRCDDIHIVDDILTSALLQVCDDVISLSIEKNW